MKKLKPPNKPKNNNKKAQKNYLYEMTEYVMNDAKWNAAIEFCNKHDMIFKIVTEKDLF